MTTSERIAAAIKHILDEDRRADRERIAELERDNNAVVQCCGELRQSIDVYLAEIQRLTEKCAALVVERDFYKGAAPSMLQAAASGSAPHTTGGLVETPAVEVKEQGPWVVYDSSSCFKWGGLSADGGSLMWSAKSIGVNRPFQDREAAERMMEASTFKLTSSVITLAEARAIEAKR